MIVPSSLQTLLSGSNDCRTVNSPHLKNPKKAITQAVSIRQSIYGENIPFLNSKEMFLRVVKVIGNLVLVVIASVYLIPLYTASKRYSFDGQSLLKILIILASKNLYLMPQMYNFIVEYFRPKLIWQCVAK